MGFNSAFKGLMKLAFTPNIVKKTQMSDVKKILSIGAEFLHADGQTDMKLVASFRNFANALKTESEAPIMVRL